MSRAHRHRRGHARLPALLLAGLLATANAAWAEYEDGFDDEDAYAEDAQEADGALDADAGEEVADDADPRDDTTPFADAQVDAEDADAGATHDDDGTQPTTFARHEAEDEGAAEEDVGLSPRRRAALEDDPDLTVEELDALESEWRDDSDDAIPTDYDEDPADAELAWEVEEPDDADAADLGLVDRAKRIERPFVRRVPTANEDASGDARQWGGKPVPDAGTPWLASLYAPRRPPVAGVPDWVNQHECGGALIEPGWILTAAHCIPADPSKLHLLRARIGSEDISSRDSVEFRIVRAVRHADYALARSPAPPNMFRNDIAVVEIAPLDDSVRIDPRQVRTIDWRAPQADADTFVTTSNWYRYEDESEGRERALLLKFEMSVSSLQECREVPGHAEPYKLHPGVFCAGHPERMVCKGDSGSPVVATNGAPVVVGIASWGTDTCSLLNEVGVYTQVAPYVGWIERAIHSAPDVTALR